MQVQNWVTYQTAARYFTLRGHQVVLINRRTEVLMDGEKWSLIAFLTFAEEQINGLATAA